jgi:hypothetical protein
MDGLLAYGTQKVDRLMPKASPECAQHLKAADKLMGVVDGHMEKGNWSRATEKFPAIFEKIGAYEVCMKAPKPRAKTPPKRKTPKKKTPKRPQRVSPRAGRAKMAPPKKTKSRKKVATRRSAPAKVRTPVKYATGTRRKWKPGSTAVPYKVGETIELIQGYGKVPVGVAKVTRAECAGKVPMVGITYRTDAGRTGVACIPVDVTKKRRRR